MPKGRNRSGTPRTGETELLSIMMQNLSINVSNAIISSDKVIATKCSVCAAIPYFCDCPMPKPDTTEMAIRHSAIKLNTYATVAMLDDGKGDAMTLRYVESLIKRRFETQSTSKIGSTHVDLPKFASTAEILNSSLTTSMCTGGL
ncbi:hypothetical protein P153DRAFT_391145 [Dothidotthia symphoricarpi CBS 119687]|uniref:Uncharacterized protein n=1 Tax=Dothidotthia symphoricarpi CBS 119687 TaxID=1392245 RepID=A0A6A5ZZ80_9PLEO|nr:uncharacterized protein P153DRAFT_391145 [Dothidotthia symphoricarpi CBS 119687]KAF2123728.1 hypothetical protein P153DRAFT_391145 [Dothidotthia symphoricarpi CBS 119687]